MELIDILRALARHPIALALGVLVAAALGLLVQYHVSVSPLALSERVTSSSGAQTRVLLDAPEQPPTVDLDSGVAETVGLRAGLLADLLATDDVRARIARDGGVAPGDLAVLTPAGDLPTLRVPLAVGAAEAARLTSEPYVLYVAADTSIPIVSLSVAAPDERAARRIASSAATAYERLVASDAGRRARLTVERLGPIRTSTTVDRPHPAIGAAVSIAVLGFWAAGLVVLVGLRRAWLRAGRPQAGPARGLLADG